MTQLILCVFAGVTGLGIVSLVEACKGALDGYEDADGFHAGGEATAVLDTDVLAADSPLPPAVCG